MADKATDVQFTPGHITLTDNGGRRTKHKIELTLGNIPTGLNQEQVKPIATLSNLVLVLIRTLIAKGVLDQKFLEEGEYDLQAIIESAEDMGGDYSMPDISVL